MNFCKHKKYLYCKCDFSSPRMKYFSQLKRFLAIPKHFRGVSDSAENLVFPSIVDRNAHRFSHLFRKAEELFARLDKVKERYGDRFGEKFFS